MAMEDKPHQIQISDMQQSKEEKKQYEILQEEEEEEEEKVDLRLLQQSPKAIQRSIEEQYKQEVEKKLASEAGTDDKTLPRPSRLTWLWG